MSSSEGGIIWIVEGMVVLLTVGKKGRDVVVELISRLFRVDFAWPGSHTTTSAALLAHLVPPGRLRLDGSGHHKYVRCFCAMSSLENCLTFKHL